jgi:hypothetical protein
MIKRFLTYPGCRVALEGSSDACDTAELLLNHLGLCGDESSDREKIDRLVNQYGRTGVDFPVITYKKR